MSVGSEGFDKGMAIAALSYTHEALVEQILAEPTLTQRQLADIFGYTPGWINRIINSDAFQVRLEERRAVLTDPAIARTLNQKLESLAHQSVSMIEEKLEKQDSASFALEALGLATKALGMGQAKTR